MIHYMKLKFPGDKNRDVSRNCGLLAIQPPDAAAGPRRFYWIVKNDLVSRGSLTNHTSCEHCLGRRFITRFWIYYYFIADN